MQTPTEAIKDPKNQYALFNKQSYRDIVPGYPIGMAPDQLVGEVEYVRKEIQEIEGVEIRGVSQVDFDCRGFPRFSMPVKYLGEAVDLAYYRDVRGDWLWITAASKALKKSALDILTDRIYSEIIQPRMHKLAEETKARSKKGICLH